MTLPLPAYAQLSPADEQALSDLFRKGTPANTLRAWERALAYIAAWKMAAFGTPLCWPEEEGVALRFVLHHAEDLTEAKGPARAVAEAEAGDTVLLAPAAASFDQYDNFEKRGEDFVACVEAEIGGK